MEPRFEVRLTALQLKVLQEATDHLGSCGYGDSRSEREALEKATRAIRVQGSITKYLPSWEELDNGSNIA